MTEKLFGEIWLISSVIAWAACAAYFVFDFTVRFITENDKGFKWPDPFNDGLLDRAFTTLCLAPVASGILGLVVALSAGFYFVVGIAGVITIGSIIGGLILARGLYRMRKVYNKHIDMLHKHDKEEEHKVGDFYDSSALREFRRRNNLG